METPTLTKIRQKKNIKYMVINPKEGNTKFLLEYVNANKVMIHLELFVQPKNNTNTLTFNNVIYEKNVYSASDFTMAVQIVNDIRFNTNESGLFPHGTTPIEPFENIIAKTKKVELPNEPQDKLVESQTTPPLAILSEETEEEVTKRKLAKLRPLPSNNK